MNMRKLSNEVWFPPAIVFVAIMIVVVGTFLVSVENRQRERNAAAQNHTVVIENSVRQRVEVFEEALRSEAGFVSVNERLDQAEWSASIEASKVLERYPGIEGVGYIDVVNAGIDEYIEQARLTDGSFALTPPGEREVYAPIRYVEPLTQLNMAAIGFDAYSEQSRRQTPTAFSLSV
jgi:CHASE1-domain containing sensor protein